MGRRPAGEIIDYDLWGYDYDDEDECYKNLSLTINNPETAKGRVYITPYSEDDKNYCKMTNNPDIAKLEGNLHMGSKGQFNVRFFVIPADGYVLDCLSTPRAYNSGDYRAKGLCKENGYPYTSLSLILAEDTADCTDK